MTVITGTAGSDTLIATGDGDRIEALGGDDLVYIGDAVFVEVGPATGNDTIVYSTSSSATITYADMALTVFLTVTETGATVEKGGDGTDSITGFSSGYDVGLDVVPGSGMFTVNVDNTNLGSLGVSSGSADDTFSVTNGDLQVNYGAATGGLYYTSDDGSRLSGTVTGDGIGTDMLSNVSDIQGTDFSDTFMGGAGDEGFLVQGGDDSVYGGAGTDTIRFDTFGTGSVTIDLGAGTADGSFQGHEFAKLIYDLEVIVSSDEDDSVTGSSGSEAVYGEDGNDTVRGGDGDDTIYGGIGNDQVWAGTGDTGNDSISGGDGSDTIGGGAGDDLISFGSNADLGFGGAGFDTLFGAAGNDTLFSGTGDDTISGGAGADILRGGEGDDAVYGGDGKDTMEGGDGRDVVYGGADADFVDGDDGDDTIGGGAGHDIIDGGAGSDELYGGAGSDVIAGGTGNDTMYGGDGSNSFIINLDHGDDYIGGFVTTGDDINTIDLVALDLGVNGYESLTITQSGPNVVIDTGEGTITLWNTNVSDIHEGNFEFF